MGMKIPIILSFLILFLFPGYSREQETSPPIQDNRVTVPIERPDKSKAEVLSPGAMKISGRDTEKGEAAAPNPSTGNMIHQEIKSIRFERDPEGPERVIFTLKGRHQFKTFAIEGDMPRLVCDFISARLGRGIGNVI